MRRMIMTAVAAAAALALAQPAAADTVTDWWDLGGRIANPYGPGAGPRTPDQDQALTRAAIAMFEAVNAIDRRYESYLGFAAGDPTASQDAAAATAAFKVLVQAFPAQKGALEESYAIAMAGFGDEKSREAGRLIGERAAAAALAAGGIDPAIPQPPYRPRTRPGQWVPTALPQIEPYFSAFRPWAIPSAEALRPPPPPALTSERWARDYDEVKRLGGKSSTERTQHQTLMARYRQAFDLAPAIRRAADAPGRTQVRNARLLALYQIAFSDSALAMAAAKAHYDYWRPITAIRNGDEDGNDATKADPNWTPLLSTPGFAEYPCGHCVVAAAAAEIMSSETGERPEGGVRVGSIVFPNSALQILPSWTEWEQQVSDSRMYGGVHYRFSNEAGQQIGRRTAKIVLDKLMKPLPAVKGRRR